MLEAQIKLLIDVISTDYKYLVGLTGNLTSLPSDISKTSVVAALISLNNKIAAATSIDDTVTAADKTWSSNKITTKINDAVASLVNGAPAALDTLKELAEQMAADESVLNSVATALGKRVRVDAAQAFTSTEKQQALDNIGAVSQAQLGNPSSDFVAYYNQKKAS